MCGGMAHLSNSEALQRQCEEKLTVLLHGVFVPSKSSKQDGFTCTTTISLDDEVVATVDNSATSSGRWASGQQPELSYVHSSCKFPRGLKVSVWTRGMLSKLSGKASLFASVTIPLSRDMGDLMNAEFTLTKSSKSKGIARVSLQLGSNEQPSNSPPARPELKQSQSGLSKTTDLSKISVDTNRSTNSSARSVGLEFENVVAWSEGYSEPGTVVSLVAPDDTDDEACGDGNKLGVKCRWEVKTNIGWMPWATGMYFDGVAGEEIFYNIGSDSYKAVFESDRNGLQINLSTGTQRKLRNMDLFKGPVETKHDLRPKLKRMKRFATMDFEDPTSQSAIALLGSWKCVATQGLGDFLKQSGVNLFQRKIAMAARWPSWEFKAPGSAAQVQFINNSAVGVLMEDMKLDGQDYTIVDGRNNSLVCQSNWYPAQNGGVLVTTRSGPMGAYTEERRVEGDRLEFTLTDGQHSWGRSFIRD